VHDRRPQAAPNKLPGSPCRGWAAITALVFAAMNIAACGSS
jgi:hypothetical protein